MIRLALRSNIRGSLIALRNTRQLNIKTRPNLSVSYLTGQPTHETRPHYIPTPGNLTPGISALEYYNRRSELVRKLPPKSIAILVGNQVQYSSGSVFHEFQQDNDLYYMTGWLEPNSVAIIEKVLNNGTAEDTALHMLVPPKNPLVELWEGAKLGLEGAYDYFNADYTENIDNIGRYISKLIARNDNIYWDDKSKLGGGLSTSSKFQNFFNIGESSRIPQTIREAIKGPGKNVRSLSSEIAELREIKSEAEVNVMYAASIISSRAINLAMAQVGSDSPFVTEKTLAKFLDYQFVKGGCDRQAYIPVVASGKNALTIHYTRNDDILYQDELVFIDAGGKLGGYCADISRAWPNSSQGFSDAQKDLYQVVLDTNKKCIDLCHEKNGLSLNDLHEKSVDFLVNGLRNLPGFQGVSRSEVARTLYPHYIGHHLGLDLHDIPSTSRFKKLVSGNVITIEPGLYIPQDNKWPKAFQGIGIRVEDDVVVGKTSDDILNLTSGCVKEIKDIESLINNGEVTTPGVNDELVLLDI